MTVAEYFNEQHISNPSKYPKLQYPFLPTLDVGSKKRSVLIPVEFIFIQEGQSRSKTLTKGMAAVMIKEAAIRPDLRMRGLLGENNSIFQEIINDDAANVGSDRL